jgi:HlyD family secretion protein
MQAAPPSMEERSKRMQGQLDAMRQFLVQSKAEPAVLASFDASAEAYKQQAARMMQRFAQGAAAGASGGAAPQGMTGGGNGARRFADRFAKAFESVRAQLSPELQRQWDQQIQALFNAKRATVYVLEKGEPVAVEIRLGVSDGSRSEVIGGLKSGQQVIVGSARSTP